MSKFAIKYEASRPAGDFKNVIRLSRKWALVRMNPGYGYTVLSRFNTQESAQRALNNISVN
jgi:hypothetical protein